MTSLITAYEWADSGNQYFISIGTNGKHVSLYHLPPDSKNGSRSNEVRELHSKSFMENINCLDYSRLRHGVVVANNNFPTLFDITNPEFDPLVFRTTSSRISTCLSLSPEDTLAVGLEKTKGHHGVHVYDRPFESMSYRSYLKNDHIVSLKFIASASKSLLVGTSNGLKELDLRSRSPTVFSITTSFAEYIDSGPFSDHFFSSVNSKNGNLAIWDRRYIKKHNDGNDVFKETNILVLPKVFTQETYSLKNAVPCYRFSPWNYNELTTLHQDSKTSSYIKRWSFGYEVQQAHDSYDNINNNNNNNNNIVQPYHLPDNIRKHNIEVSNIDSLFVSKCKNTKISPQQAGRVISFDHCESYGGYFGSFVVLTASGKVIKVPVIDGDSSMDFSNYNTLTISNGNELLIESPVNNIGDPDDMVNNDNDVNLNNNEPEKPQDSGKVDEDEEVESILNTDEESGEEDDDSSKDGDDDEDDEKTTGSTGSSRPIREILQDDIASVMYQRAQQNYNLTDLHSNSELFSQFNKNYYNKDQNYLNSNYEQLRICWKWLYHSNENCRRRLTIQDGLNISFEGIYNIWDGIKEILRDEERFNPEINSCFTSLSSKVAEKEFLRILEKIMGLVHKPNKTYMTSIDFSARTKKAIQRRYCLFSCGWYITKEEFDTKIDTLISLKYYEKAAGLCVFQGDVLRAIDILSSIPDDDMNRGPLQEGYEVVDLRIIAAAMMGFFNRNMERISEEASYNYDGEPLWKDQCRKLSQKLSSPYLRAIFAYLTDRNWQDVLEEPSLALKDKLLIALKYLPDDKLTEYLKITTTDVIRTGNPDGIMLTGLTRKGIALLQTYNDRYTDIQTVALISAFAVPRFFDDLRANNWMASYCHLLNGWKLFKIRARFDIKRRQLSKNDLYRKRTLVIGAGGDESSSTKKLVDQQQDDAMTMTMMSVESNSGRKSLGTVSRRLDIQFFLPKKDRQLYLKCIQCDRDISHLLHNKKQHGYGKHHHHHGSSSGVGCSSAGGGAGGVGGSVIGGGAKVSVLNGGGGTVVGGGGGGVNGRKLMLNKDNSTITCVCGAPLPKCAICLYSLGAPIRYNNDPKVNTQDYFRDWCSFCLNCNHGMHSKHADQWFQDHTVCPVPDCNCHCVADNI
ncbi:Sea4 protein [Saccharomycopsis crataegensis]|uniref:Sea4 protein n=1 Tax=Saccharomycopsis crataegensis TaxID=43959 RepID=A0AAV5QX62_9ASCO|nr:Sea4 protein [Saccharomycopsis crataegensis]